MTGACQSGAGIRGGRPWSAHVSRLGMGWAVMLGVLRTVSYHVKTTELHSLERKMRAYAAASGRTLFDVVREAVSAYTA